jgi:hypothetical protein
MSRTTDDLIAALAADLKPVSRLRPPMLRAAVALAVMLALASAAVLLFAHPAILGARMAHPRFAVEFAATLLTGIAGVVAAFHLSLPDRSRLWALLPAPPALVWLTASGVGCWRSWVVRGPAGLGFGQTAFCFVFIVATSLPIGGFLLYLLSRARPLQPGLTGAAGGLGAAALCAFVLQFFHPDLATVVDLGYHLAAVALVVSAASALERTATARRAAL